MEIYSLLILAFAVSIDGFAAGLAYGIKRIKIPFISLILIGVTSALAIWISMSIGTMLTAIITPTSAEIFGGIILIGLGSWLIIQNINIVSIENKSTSRHRLQEVLSEPLKADFDGSGTISSKEALILGMALAMDAMAAGFGASLLGFHSIWTPIFVGVCKLLLIPMGVKIGKELTSVFTSKLMVFLPGSILIILGMINFV